MDSVQKGAVSKRINMRRNPAAGAPFRRPYSLSSASVYVFETVSWDSVRHALSSAPNSFRAFSTFSMVELISSSVRVRSGARSVMA